MDLNASFGEVTGAVFLYQVIMQCRNFYVSSNSDCSEQNVPCFSSVFSLEVLGGKGDSS